MSDIIEGPPASHASVLWSIADSVEPAFPNAADTLRAIALDLKQQVPAAIESVETMPGVRRHCRECDTSWNVLTIRECPQCHHVNDDPLVGLASVPETLGEFDG